MKKNPPESLGAILYGIGCFLLAFSVMPVAIYFTVDGVLFSRSFWIALLYVAILIVCILSGRKMARQPGEECAQTVIEVVVCLVPNYLLACLLLDMGKVQTASHYALIPYLVLVAIILPRRWNKLTPADQILVGWSWIPLILFLMPVIHRYREGKDVW